MHISSFEIRNYKSFNNSGVVSLTPGFNLIVGKNDAGKTAILEALSLLGGSKPHRSPISVPVPTTPVNQQSVTRLSFLLTGVEIGETLREVPNFLVPTLQSDPDTSIRTFESALSDGGTFVGEWTNGSLQTARLLGDPDPIPASYFHSYQNQSYPTGFNPVRIGFSSGGSPSFGTCVCANLQSRIYGFRAERMNVGSSPAAGVPHLRPDASNLPEVLNRLIASNTQRYDRLMGHIRTIFPHITQVTAPMVGGSTARIDVWTIPISTERDDLAVPLSESGTGIGQVLALLYVVVTSTSPRFVLIDEPQSFLHPGAVRKLFEILRHYSQHQYVITTHAPVLITAGGADTLLLAKRTGYETTIDRIDPKLEQDLRLSLVEVGARLSDVFGADRILWVEGKTEEVCFPPLLKGLAGVSLGGIQILGVIATGDLESRLASRVLDIYSRLTHSASLLPPAVAFVFDKDGRDDIERERIERAGNNLVRWLPRRMFENYLLDASAIAAVINEIDLGRESALTREIVEGKLSECAQRRTDFTGEYEETGFQSESWYDCVNGSALLDEVFGELTGQRVLYRKVEHGLRLTEFLIAERSDALRSLAALLSGLIHAEIIEP